MKKISLICINLVGFICFTYAQTVTIGTQVWMTKNLDVSSFKNGDPIPEAKTNEEWEKAGENKQPAWCYYENDPANGPKYGKLYNGYAVNDQRGLSPAGYHIPSDAEWSKLKKYLGSDAGTKMKSKSAWISYTTRGSKVSGNGSNTSGFSGLPGGYRSYDGDFNDIGEFGIWWSASESPSNYACTHNLHYINGSLSWGNDSKKCGYSVRCLRD
jgi:uncharacterized protein (TIGR02145 family)